VTVEALGAESSGAQSSVAQSLGAQSLGAQSSGGQPAPPPPPIRFNPFGAEFRRDPYPLYRQLRQRRPVHRTLGMWVLTRHADVQAVLSDRTFSAGIVPALISRQAGRVPGADVGQLERLGAKSLVFTDNPDHGRLRGLVNRVFSTDEVDRLRPRIAEAAARLVANALEAGEMDGVADLAGPLPLTVLCDWMALPGDLRSTVGTWTHAVRFLLEPGLMRSDDITHVSAVVERFAAALDEVVAGRRRAPGEDLVSRLLAARTAGGDRLTDEEIVFVCIMCFVAGLETTKSLLGNGLLALLRHPAQHARLRAEPRLAGRAVDEMLRYDCPLQLTKRVATRRVELGDETIAPGDQVLLCLGAANRDPAVFDRPDAFDITRPRGRHLAFGHGMHGCLGGPLAHAQVQITLECLYREAGDLRLTAEEPQWQDHSFIVRGPRRLPMALRRSR